MIGGIQVFKVVKVGWGRVLYKEMYGKIVSTN
jgi:hypothetical protein